MKKKLFLLMLILLITSVSAFALPFIDLQLGGGYNGYFLSNSETIQSYPLGLAVYGGVGYKFFPTLSAGAEYEIANSWSLDDLGLGKTFSITEQIPKVYVKFNALNILAISALAGMDIQTYKSDGDKSGSEQSFTMGARVAFLFGYAQYMMIFNEDRINSRISAGVVLSK